MRFSSQHGLFLCAPFRTRLCSLALLAFFFSLYLSPSPPPQTPTTHCYRLPYRAAPLSLLLFPPNVRQVFALCTAGDSPHRPFFPCKATVGHIELFTFLQEKHSQLFHLRNYFALHCWLRAQSHPSIQVRMIFLVLLVFRFGHS